MTRRPGINVAEQSLSWRYEEEANEAGERVVAGLDEAGRGCWAGPVVAAAVFFRRREDWPSGLRDSKKLTRGKRRELYERISSDTEIEWAVGEASVEEIDSLNILQASFLAMRRAWEALTEKPDYLLVDGSNRPAWKVPCSAIVRGDGQSPSIAAAAILAKETRDRIMEKHDADYPGYGFANHKGYGTKEHQRGLEAYGICPIHRKSFAPVRQTLLPFV